jgi:hypothetical protein
MEVECVAVLLVIPPSSLVGIPAAVFSTFTVPGECDGRLVDISVFPSSEGIGDTTTTGAGGAHVFVESVWSFVTEEMSFTDVGLVEGVAGDLDVCCWIRITPPSPTGEEEYEWLVVVLVVLVVEFFCAAAAKSWASISAIKGIWSIETAIGWPSKVGRPFIL